jgi:hypothetical protein
MKDDDGAFKPFMAGKKLQVAGVYYYWRLRWCLDLVARIAFFFFFYHLIFLLLTSVMNISA